MHKPDESIWVFGRLHRRSIRLDDYRCWNKHIKTPAYTASQNTQSRTGDVFVEVTGDAKAKVKTTFRGLQYENNDLNAVLNNQYDDQKKWIQQNFKIPAFDISGFSMVNKKDIIPSAVVNADLVIKRFER